LDKSLYPRSGEGIYYAEYTLGFPRALNLSLLNSSPPDGTNLREANAAPNRAVYEITTLESPVKRYISRTTFALEKAYFEVALLRKETTEQQGLLEARKKRTEGRRVAIEGRFVFNTEEILDVVRKAEEATRKKPSERRRIGTTNIEIEEEVENSIGNVSTDSESDCIVVLPRK